MKRRTASLAIPLLAAAVSPAAAQQNLYDNGPINGATDAVPINMGYVVSDSMSFAFEKIKLSAFSLGVWESPGDVMNSLDWSFTTQENGGTILGSGTASGGNLTDKFLSINQFGYDIDEITVSGLNVNLEAGSYWLNLQNASVPSGDPVFWDENSGVGCGGNNCPSLASESAVGTYPSEAFTIYGSSSGTTPEPSSLMLFFTGLLGLVGALRRKLF